MSAPNFLYNQLPTGITSPHDSTRQQVFSEMRPDFSDNSLTNISNGLRELGPELNRRSFREVVASATAGNASDCLEAGLRMWTGCTTPVDHDGAMNWLLRIASATHPDTQQPIQRSIRARALSLLANAQWEKATEDMAAWNIDAMYRAAWFANTCLELGLLTPCLLHIAKRTRTMMDHPNFQSQNWARFREFEYLWEALEAQEKVVNAKEAKRDKKVAATPLAYRCAAEGCGIEATKKSALSKCAGKCPMDQKPYYCSKECQRADWKRHKPICKHETMAKSAEGPELVNQAVVASKSTTAADIERGDSTLGDHLRTDGKETMIEMPAPGLPGGKIKMSSSTISPAFMKEIRQAAEDALHVVRDEVD
ncbi:hypothetical protein K474DRAFT_1772898 [Panus rudis PR-1116 ss-1]|nr:hypothetical protein K474DRAFT_1772898 [Panus rudis PR-1116 ss-1]